MTFALTPEQAHILVIINTVATTLSLLGAGFMIWTYCSIPTIRTFSMKLVISLIVTDTITGLTNLLAFYDQNEFICSIEGFLRNASNLSSVIWVTIISWISYKQICNYEPKVLGYYSRLLILNISLCIIPATIATVSTIFELTPIRFGHNFGNCMIVPDIFNIWAFELPVWTMISMIFYFSCKIYSHLKGVMDDFAVIEYKSALIYPLILVVLWMPSLINRFLVDFFDIHIYAILLLHNGCLKLQGFANAIAYGKSEFSKIKSYFEKKSFTSSTIRSESLLGLNLVHFEE